MAGQEKFGVIHVLLFIIVYVNCRDDIEHGAPSFGLGNEFKAPMQGRDTHLLCMSKPYIGNLNGYI